VNPGTFLGIVGQVVHGTASGAKVGWAMSVTVKQVAKFMNLSEPKKTKTPLDTLMAAWQRASTVEKIAFLVWAGDEADPAKH
jgi:hypothetical protein